MFLLEATQLLTKLALFVGSDRHRWFLTRYCAKPELSPGGASGIIAFSTAAYKRRNFGWLASFFVLAGQKRRAYRLNVADSLLYRVVQGPLIEETC